MIKAQDIEIQALVDAIKQGQLLLPELQRGYVWKAPQVRNLFDSLYHNYPSGQLLVWETDDLPFSRSVSVDEVETDQRRPQLLLDGQQRLTSLAAVMLGRPLHVRGTRRPIDIAFNVHTEKFEVTGPRQRGETGWISLTKLFTQGVLAIWIDLKLNTSDPEARFMHERLNRLENIRKYSYRVNMLDQLSYEEVTDIFVRINSGGTTLGSADLALAQVSSRWRGITQEFEAYQMHARKQELELDSGLLLRAMSLLLTGQSRLNLLFRGDRRQVTVEVLQSTWKRVKEGIDQAIAFVMHNCGIDRLGLLPTNNVLIPLGAFFDRFGRDVSPAQARELQRWVYMALIWSRYSSTVETKLDQDYAALAKEQPIKTMIQNIEDQVGRRPVTERELRDQRKNSSYMTMAYVLARNAGAQDWFNGVAIGGSQALELHHIFPKAVLRETYNLQSASRTVDQVANLAFLSKRANNRISNQSPAEYLSKLDPQRLRAQSIPLDPALWTINHFEKFLLERRRLLAEEINTLLQSLTEEPSLIAFGDAEMLKTRVETIEHRLRDLVDERLTESRGVDAWNHCVPGDIRRSVRGRIEQRVSANPFEIGQYDSLAGKLIHCQFSDYPKIITANWSLFEDVFGQTAKFEQHHRTVTDARNTLAHNRLLSHVDRASTEAGLSWFEACLRRLDLVEEDEGTTDDEAGVAEEEIVAVDD